MIVDEELRYPIGRMPVPDGPMSASEREAWIARIESLPLRLRHAVAGLGPEQWGTPYRPGGWSVRQLVHHVADSHLQAYARFKLALTEDDPVIKPYDPDAWAALPDSREAAPEVSLAILEGLHLRWVVLMRSTPDPDFRRTYRHPEHGRSYTLHQMVAQYAWHSDHHLRHVTALGEREGWLALPRTAPDAAGA